MKIQTVLTDEYPTRYAAFRSSGILFIQKDQTKHELAVICYPVDNLDLEGLIDGLHVEIHSHASRGIAVDCCATYPDLWRQQTSVYLVDFPDIYSALDFAIVWYLYGLSCFNDKLITKLIEFNLWIREEIEPIMSTELNDQQRAHLLQLYKSKLQQLGDDEFFNNFDEIREECYKSMGVQLRPSQPSQPSIPFYIDPVHSAASTLGRKGGLSKSPAKTFSSRENGKKGGRPKKDSISKGVNLSLIE